MLSSKRSPILTRKKPPVQYAEPVTKRQKSQENVDPNTSTVPSPSVPKPSVPKPSKAQPKQKALPKKRKTKKELVNQKIQKMGVDPEVVSRCVKTAIYKGFIKVKGVPEDLKMVVHSDVGECGHEINATLGDLFDQPDYAGMDYENGLEDATVLCTVEGCAEEDGSGRTYVTDICIGAPCFDSGKSHNHCKAPTCAVFGVCLGDYREAHCDDCGKHYWRGLMGYPCGCKGECDPDAFLMWQ